MSDSHLTYLQKNGIEITSSNSGNSLIELSSLVSIRDEGLYKLKGVSLMLPCILYDSSEVNLKEETYTVLSDSVMLLTEKREDRFIYVVV